MITIYFLQNSIRAFYSVEEHYELWVEVYHHNSSVIFLEDNKISIITKNIISVRMSLTFAVVSINIRKLKFKLQYLMRSFHFLLRANKLPRISVLGVLVVLDRDPAVFFFLLGGAFLDTRGLV